MAMCATFASSLSKVPEQVQVDCFMQIFEVIKMFSVISKLTEVICSNKSAFEGAVAEPTNCSLPGKKKNIYIYMPPLINSNVAE